MNLYTIDDFIELYINDGLTYNEITAAIDALQKLIGDFRYLLVSVSSDQCSLSYGQLRLLIEKGAKAWERNLIDRIGIVVNTSLQTGMTLLFFEAIQDLNCTVEVFKDKNSALDWLFEGRDK
jgi:hypothetical protein